MRHGIDVQGAIFLESWAILEEMWTLRSRTPLVREHPRLVKAAHLGENGDAIVRWNRRMRAAVRR